MAGAQPLPWGLIQHGSRERGEMQWTLSSLEGLSPKLQVLRANGTPSALGTRVDWAVLTGLADSNFRALTAGGRADSASTVSSSCSWHFNVPSLWFFQKHRHIRKEVCPEIAIWMNVTLVGQQGKLEEVMCLQLMASSHGPHSKQCTHLWGRAFAWVEKYSSIDRFSMGQGRTEKEGRNNMHGWLWYIKCLMCTRPTVSFHPENALYQPHLRDEETSSERDVLFC